MFTIFSKKKIVTLSFSQTDGSLMLKSQSILIVLIVLMFSELKKSIKLDIMIKERNIIFGNHLVILNTKNMFPKLSKILIILFLILLKLISSQVEQMVQMTLEYQLQMAMLTKLLNIIHIVLVQLNFILKTLNLMALIQKKQRLKIYLLLLELV